MSLMNSETSSKDEGLRTVQVIYHGQVQGVGFRATTADLARQYPVVGFVRNLRDGTVELVAQGKSETVQSLLDAIARRFAGKITQAVTTPGSLEEELEEFRIRH